MKATVTPAAENAITDIAQRHGLSREAVQAMLFAVHAGGGTMAQFSIPELGGSGQWMRGGMTMVGGNMFDNALKARVDALCAELAQLLATTTVFPASTAGGAGLTSGQLVAGRPRRAEFVRWTERQPATRSFRARGGWRSRSTESQGFSTPASTRSVAFTTAAGQRLRHGELHQPVRHVRRLEPS